MSRIAALFAIIAFAVMVPVMAHPMMAKMPGAAPMAGIAMGHHVTGADANHQAPCEQAASMSCNGCCILVPPMAVSLPVGNVTVTDFVLARHQAQSGHVVPPALPPPRG